MATVVIFPQIVLHTPENVPPDQLARLALAFAAAFAVENGNQVVISAANWQKLQGRQIHMEFEARADRFIVRVEVGDYVEDENVPEPSREGTAASDSGDVLDSAP